MDDGSHLPMCPDCKRGVFYVDDPHGHAPDCPRHHWVPKVPRIPRQHDDHVGRWVAYLCGCYALERDLPSWAVVDVHGFIARAWREEDGEWYGDWWHPLAFKGVLSGLLAVMDDHA